MEMNDATAAAVVSVRFDPGVQADAKAMGVALIDARSLAEVATLAAKFPPSIDTLKGLLHESGLIPTEKWAEVRTARQMAQQQI